IMRANQQKSLKKLNGGNENAGVTGEAKTSEMTKGDIKQKYNSMTREERAGIEQAGENQERYETLKSVPMSELTDDDKEFMKTYGEEYEDEEERDINEVKFN